MRIALCALAGLCAVVGRVQPAFADDQPPVSQPGYLSPRQAGSAGIADLVLIYQGGTHRPAWTPEQFEPYVSFCEPSSAARQWLFDGFLFIEFKDGRGYEFARGYGQKLATRQQWQWLLDQQFAPGQGIAALDVAIARAAARLGAPSRPRQVVLTLPEPIAGQTNWGVLQDRPLDFRRPGDRVAACVAHVDEALDRWRALAPRHLRLAGFYWVAEHAADAEVILPRIADALRARGKRFFWIPYWNARGATHWRALGFDAAYLQPNHFFDPKVPDSRLDAACALAQANGLGLEFECDGRAIDSPDTFRPRLHTYLNAFERWGVRTNAAVAYYEGGGALRRMADSSQADVRGLYVTLARWVAERQKRADQSWTGP